MVSTSSFSNSGSKRSMIACGSAQSASSVTRPNWTPPPYDEMLTPTPMSPDAGTQNIVWRSVEPQNLSGTAGPGTLVMTAVAFFANRPRIASCSGWTICPATASTTNASNGW